MNRRGAAALIPLLGLAGPAIAAEADAETVPGIQPPPGARLPLGLAARDEAGRALTLGEALGGRPAVFAFADYTCTVLCGTALGLAAAMLPQTRLLPGVEYRFVVLGLDPRDGPAAAAAMKRAYLGESGGLAAAAHFLTAAAPAVATAMQALGYRARYREGPAAEGFDHPLALLILAPDGRLSALLPGLGAQPEALRAALLAAAAAGNGGGGTGGFAAGVRLLCQGIGLPAGGARGAAVRAALAASGAATLLGMAGGALLLRRRARERPR